MERFSALLAPALLNSPNKGQWRVAFHVFFDLRLNKQLGKQSRDWWFDATAHYDVTVMVKLLLTI